MSVPCLPVIQARALLLSFTKFGLIAPGQIWKSSDFIVSPHAGDCIGPPTSIGNGVTLDATPRTPRWLRDSDGWYGVGYHAGMPGGLSGSYAETLPKAAARAAELG